MFSVDDISRMKYPYELFSDDMEEAKKQYVDLMKIYNPNLNGKNSNYTEVNKKINSLYKEAEKNFRNGIWSKPGFIKVKGEDGKDYSINFRISHNFELGTMYIGDESIMYLIEESNKELAINGLNRINSLTYINEEMKKEFYKDIPTVVSAFTTINGKMCIIIKKEEDFILLKDLLQYCNGRLSFSTVSWILKSLYNLACFIQYNNIAHNGITIDNYFVSLKKHKGALLGGWWYATSKENKILSVPRDVYNIMATDMKKNKDSSIKLDLESIRLLGRMLLGDKSGSVLSANNEIPKNVKVWLRGTASNNSYLEYGKWCNIIKGSINEIKQKKVQINNEDLYKSIGGF